MENNNHMTTTRQQIGSAHDALAFLLGGNATFTLVSQKTGARYTFRVRGAEDNPRLFFVSVLTGSNNDSDYTYIGVIRLSPAAQFGLTKASRMGADSLPVRGFIYMLRYLVAGALAPNTEFWHEGHCGRCGRTLTVPESLAAGIGPECAKRMAAKAA